MALNANSYGSVAEVEALTRHLCGDSGYTATTRPLLTEVERFIDRCSAILNTALATYGFDVPVTQATVIMALADWVTTQAAAYAELTQRGAGFNDQSNSRYGSLLNIHEAAHEFVASNMRGWQRLGAAMDNVTSTGLVFTADEPHIDRTDPDNTGREQPVFRRRQWDSMRDSRRNAYDEGS